MARTRLGKGAISFTVDGDEYNLDLQSALLDSEESDTTPTFADRGGSYSWFLTVTALQSGDADSLHQFVWDNPGAEVAFVFAPEGMTKTRYAGSVIVPGGGAQVGGEANSDWSFEARFNLVAKPTRTKAA